MNPKNKEKIIEVKQLDAKTNKELMKDFTAERTGFVQIGPDKFIHSSGYGQIAHQLYNFEARPSDIWIVTFPRSGTTLTQEISWLLANNLDFDLAKKIPLSQRFFSFELSTYLHPLLKKEVIANRSEEEIATLEKIFTSCIPRLEASTERRFIKTHIPFSGLNPDFLKFGPKVIYVARNPKDVIVSFYHYCRTLKILGFKNDFRKYWYYFKQDLVYWTPYWTHIRQGWNRRHEKNVLFLFYEDINMKLNESLRKIADFLEVKCNDVQLAQLENHVKFENFKKNPSVSNPPMLRMIGNENEASFVREGKVGGWKDYFVDGLNEEVDEWIEENLSQIGIKFPEFI